MDGKSEKSRKNLRILLVDDADTFLKIASNMLKHRGFEHLNCLLSGKDTLELYEKLNPDVIIMDTCMPGLFGYKVCEEIRKTVGRSIYIIGMSDMNYRAEWEAAGVDLFLSKNEYLNTGALYEALDRLVDRLNGEKQGL